MTAYHQVARGEQVRLSLGRVPYLLSFLLVAVALPRGAMGQGPLTLPETTPGGYYVLIGSNADLDVPPLQQCLAVVVKPDDISPHVSRYGVDMKVQHKIGPFPTLSGVYQIMEERGFKQGQYRWWTSPSGCKFVPFTLPPDWMAKVAGQYSGSVEHNRIIKALVLDLRLDAGRFSAEYEITDAQTGQTSSGTLRDCRGVKDERVDLLAVLRIDCELRGGGESGTLRIFFWRTLNGFGGHILGHPGGNVFWNGQKRGGG